jgi:hypothetical protein
MTERNEAIPSLNEYMTFKMNPSKRENMDYSANAFSELRSHLIYSGS